MNQQHTTDRHPAHETVTLEGLFSGLITWSASGENRTARFSIAEGPRNNRTQHRVFAENPAPELVEQWEAIKGGDPVRVIGRPVRLPSGSWILELVSISRPDEKTSRKVSQWVSNPVIEVTGNMGRVLGAPQCAVKFGLTQPKEIEIQRPTSFLVERIDPAERRRRARILSRERGLGWGEEVLDKPIQEREMVFVDSDTLTTTPRQFARFSIGLRGRVPAELQGQGTWLKVVCWHPERFRRLYSVRVGELVTVCGRLVTREYDGSEITELQLTGFSVKKTKAPNPDLSEMFVLPNIEPRRMSRVTLAPRPEFVEVGPAPDGEPNHVCLRGKVVKVRKPTETGDGVFRLRVTHKGACQTFTIVPAPAHLERARTIEEGNFLTVKGPLSSVKRMVKGEKREYPVIVAHALRQCRAGESFNRVTLQGVAAEVSSRACRLFVEWREAARGAEIGRHRDARACFSVEPSRRACGRFERSVRQDRRIRVEGSLIIRNGIPSIQAEFFRSAGGYKVPITDLNSFPLKDGETMTPVRQ